ncbi:MAG TPA: hypothetical protein VG860_20125 [Terriglobia bacterium]|jgi:hypothetical protein|nr:hypothetical protein [Terriglobia bacterium]
MKAACKYVLMFAVAIVVATGLGMAKPSEKSADITITAVTVTPDGGQLQPGMYKMTLLNASTAPEVAFYKGKKLICKCPVRVENLPTKAGYTEMLVETATDGTRMLKTLSVGGWTEKVIFAQTGGAGAGR